MRNKAMRMMGFLLLWAMICKATFCQDGETITIEARGAGTDKRQALENAMREAVEKGCGIFIESMSSVEDFRLCYDAIQSTSAGFVQSYEVLKEWVEAGVVKISIRAKVSRADFEGATKILLERWGHPKFLVRIPERINGQFSETQVIQTNIQGVLAQKGFVVIDEGQFEENRFRELSKAVIEGDVNKIAHIGGKMGAQVVIVGAASGSISPPMDVYGVSMLACQADVTCRVVRTDTAEVMVVGQESSRRLARDPQAAANQAFLEASQKLSSDLAKKIRISAMKEIQNGRRYEIIIEGIDYGGFVKFKQALQEVEGVRSISEGSVEEGIAEFFVEAKLLRDNLVVAMCKILPSAEPEVNPRRIKLTITRRTP